MDPMTAAATVTQSLKLVKEIREIDKNIGEAELKAKMAELYSTLADVKMALADTHDQMKAKDAEIERLRGVFEFRSELVEVRGFKFEKFPDDKPRGDAFCPRCEQNRGRFYRLQYGRRTDLPAICPECKSEFRRPSRFNWEEQ